MISSCLTQQSTAWTVIFYPAKNRNKYGRHYRTAARVKRNGRFDLALSYLSRNHLLFIVVAGGMSHYGGNVAPAHGNPVKADSGTSKT